MRIMKVGLMVCLGTALVDCAKSARRLGVCRGSAAEDDTANTNLWSVYPHAWKALYLLFLAWEAIRAIFVFSNTTKTRDSLGKCFKRWTNHVYLFALSGI